MSADAPWRRAAVRVLRKDPGTPVERFGFRVHEPASRERVAGIVAAFFGGYNASLEGAAAAEVRRRCASRPEILHPFAFEGSGMGYGARGLLDRRARAARFEAFVEGLEPGWRFLYYIGLGIWTAFLGGWMTRRVARALPVPRYAGLLWDGVGFQRGFFHRVRDRAAHRPLERLPVELRAHAYRGYGRSLWFVFRDDPAGLEAAVAALPEHARAATRTGVGLALIFTSIDDLGAAEARLERLPAAWRRDAERGARLALFVRHQGQPRALEAWIGALPGPAAARWRAHLEHALRAHAATCERPTFLLDFTEAC